MKSYKRILLKLSGEALKDKKNDLVLSKEVLDNLLHQVSTLVKKHKVQVAIVVGGGNIWRGVNIEKLQMKDSSLERADYMGMTATTFNALGISTYFNQKGLKTYMQNALDFEKISDKLNSKKAIAHLNKYDVVIFGGGTGKPFLSTDTAAADRALEIKADVIFVAKNGTDGVYTADPNKVKTAKFIEYITYQEMISKKLNAMDLAAMKKLKGKNIDILLFDFNKKDNIINIFKQPEKTKKTIITN